MENITNRKPNGSLYTEEEWLKEINKYYFDNPDEKDSLWNKIECELLMTLDFYLFAKNKAVNMNLKRIQLLTHFLTEDGSISKLMQRFKKEMSHYDIDDPMQVYGGICLRNYKVWNKVTTKHTKKQSMASLIARIELKEKELKSKS